MKTFTYLYNIYIIISVIWGEAYQETISSLFLNWLIFYPTGSSSERHPENCILFSLNSMRSSVVVLTDILILTCLKHEPPCLWYVFNLCSTYESAEFNSVIPRIQNHCFARKNKTNIYYVLYDKLTKAIRKRVNFCKSIKWIAMICMCGYIEFYRVGPMYV